MGRISFDDANSVSNGSNSEQINFFSLNDGSEAVVRFMDDSVSDFEILALHNIELNGKYRKVSCLRNPHDNIDKCPFCNAGFKITNRVFFKLIHYYIDGNQVKAVPEVWDAPYSIAKTLSKYIQDYGPLSDYLCKITRQGTKLDTTYIISPNLSKNMYPDDIFVKDNSRFDNYNALGRIVLDKSFSDMEYFIANKEFPAAQTNSNTANNFDNQFVNTTTNNNPSNFVAAEPKSNFVNPNNNSDSGYSAEPRRMPWETQAINRPNRY